MTAHSPSRASGDKRERILDAAERVFARHGFFTATVAEIAKGAGVADGTIYLYFKNKDDLLISLFESRMERVHRELSAAIEPGRDAPDKLRRFVRKYLELCAEHPFAAEVICARAPSS
jgi:TetR/AcrR family fatty acid metabolism transcriptional regulator